MTDLFLLDTGVQPLAGGDFSEAWAEALRRAPALVRYGASLLLVGVAVAFGFALKPLVTPANVTLIFVLPVVIAATSFGWGPSLATVVAGVLAFDFFFTEPYFQFTIANATDLWAATLLFLIAAIVSAVAAEAQRRAASAQRAARQASALQVVAHMVIEGRPRREILQMAAWSLGSSSGHRRASSRKGRAAWNSSRPAPGRRSPPPMKRPRLALSRCTFRREPAATRSRRLASTSGPCRPRAKSTCWAWTSVGRRMAALPTRKGLSKS